jgi:phospholipase/carboxylesterase
MELIPRIEIEPDSPADASVIWLHGLGADGNDFTPIVPHLELGPQSAVRFIFPHAPVSPVTINGGARMPSWYDIVDFDPRRIDTDGVLESAARITDLVAHERERGVESRRIILAGFSQGGAVALHVGLRHPELLAGLLALSTYMVRGDTLEEERSAHTAGLHVMQAHGTQDPMVSIELGRSARDELGRLGCEVDWHTYEMGHEVHPREISEIGAWIRTRLSR